VIAAKLYAKVEILIIFRNQLDGLGRSPYGLVVVVAAVGQVGGRGRDGLVSVCIYARLVYSLLIVLFYFVSYIVL